MILTLPFAKDVVFEKFALKASHSSAQADIDSERVKTSLAPLAAYHSAKPFQRQKSSLRRQLESYFFSLPQQKTLGRTLLVFLLGGTNLERPSSIPLIAQGKKFAPAQRYLLQEQLTITLASYVKFLMIMVEEHLGMRSCR